MHRISLLCEFEPIKHELFTLSDQFVTYYEGIMLMVSVYDKGVVFLRKTGELVRYRFEDLEESYTLKMIVLS